MPEMNEYLAQFYGTGKTASVAAPEPSDADLEKQASVDLFMKIASEQQIPLDTMSDEDVQHLYGEFVKAAGENPFAKKDEDGEKDEDEEKKKDEEKKAAAQAEFESRKEASAKVAEADYLGRVIAHSFVQEVGNITKEAGGADAEAVLRASALARNSHARRAVGQIRQAVGKAVDTVKEHGGKAHEAAGKHLENVGHRMTGAHGGLGKVSPETAKRLGGAAYGTGAAAAAGGAAAVHHSRKEAAAAFDDLAGDQAVAFAVEQGWDGEQATRKTAAVLELSLLGDSEKVASAADYETGVGIRALELLEAAGYPVTWTE